MAVQIWNSNELEL